MTMKKRLLSFLLTLLMLFSALSLQVFAAGTESTQGTSASTQVDKDLSQEKMAEYFRKYGTIGKVDGGYNLTASQLLALVGKNNILVNSEFEAWPDYTNATGNLTLAVGANYRFNNDTNGERIVPKRSF